MIHAGDVSFYTKAGLLRHGQLLFNWRRWGVNEQYWRDMVSGEPEDVRTTMYIERSDGEYVVHMVRRYPSIGGAMLYVSPVSQWVFPGMNVWRIQRSMHLFLQRRREKRRLALAMCWHARLGAGSIMACLDTDMMLLLLAQE